jgi:hypothetical protein
MLAFGILKINAYSWGAGWSEVYPINAPSYAAAATIMQALAGFRMACACTDVTLMGTLLSDTAVKGDSYPMGVSLPQPGTGFSPTSTGQISLALRLQITGGVLKRSARFVRALPTFLIGAGGSYTPVSAFTTALNTFLAYLIANVSIATKIHGAVSPPFYSFTAITGATLVAALEARKIGRPFGLHRGRLLIA